MKIKFVSLFVSLLIMSLSIPALSQQTTTPATAHPTPVLSVENAKNIAIAVGAPTNINQVLVEILSGTRDAAKEIYGASKKAIHKSIDFVGEQTPDIIKQFLMWRFVSAAIWAVVWLIVSALFLLFCL